MLLIRLKLKKAKPIPGALADYLRNSHFATVLTRGGILNLLNIWLTQIKKSGFVAVRELNTSRFVMGHILNPSFFQ